MKKILSICLVACLMAFSFVSCEPEGLEDKTPVTGHPEKDAEGLYVGNWTRIASTGDTIVAPGSLRIIADTAYMAEVSVASDTVLFREKYTKPVSQMTALANIVQESYFGQTFYSLGGEATGFGTSFRGRVSSDEKATLSFKLEKAGRGGFVFNYSFEGVKQSE